MWVTPVSLRLSLPRRWQRITSSSTPSSTPLPWRCASPLLLVSPLYLDHVAPPLTKNTFVFLRPTADCSQVPCGEKPLAGWRDPVQGAAVQDLVRALCSERLQQVGDFAPGSLSCCGAQHHISNGAISKDNVSIVTQQEDVMVMYSINVLHLPKTMYMHTRKRNLRINIGRPNVLRHLKNNISDPFTSIYLFVYLCVYVSRI